MFKVNVMHFISLPVFNFILEKMRNGSFIRLCREPF